MNPAVIELLSTLFRYALLLIFPKLVAWGVFTDEQGNRLISSFTEMFITWIPVGAVVLYGLWKTLRKRLNLNVARNAPEGTSEASVKAKVARMSVKTQVTKAFANPVKE